MIVNNEKEVYVILPAKPGEARRAGELQAIRDQHRLVHEKGTPIEEFLTKGPSPNATAEEIEQWREGKKEIKNGSFEAIETGEEMIVENTQTVEELKEGVAQVLPFATLSFGPDQVVTMYLSLRTYLKVLVSQEQEDLGAIQRATDLMALLRPKAVEASEILNGGQV